MTTSPAAADEETSIAAPVPPSNPSSDPPATPSQPPESPQSSVPDTSSRLSTAHSVAHSTATDDGTPSLKAVDHPLASADKLTPSHPLSGVSGAHLTAEESFTSTKLTDSVAPSRDIASASVSVVAESNGSAVGEASADRGTGSSQSEAVLDSNTMHFEEAAQSSRRG